MTTTAVRPRAPSRTRREWWIPASLLALTFVPAAAGAARLVDLSSGRTEENARFFDLPVLTHQRWMARAYAVGQGAGTQALVLGPMVLFVDQPGGTLKASGMAFAWVLNLVVAEWLVRRSQARRSGQPRRRVW